MFSSDWKMRRKIWKTYLPSRPRAGDRGQYRDSRAGSGGGKASRPDQSDCFLGPNVIELCRLADITFLGLHGGEGENGKLQATFDLLGIRYTGPDSLGCAVAMDKGFTKQVFLQSGIDTPAGACLHKNAADRSVSSLGLDFPVVIKPCSGGSSIGVYIVNTESEYKEALEKSFRYEDEVVIEEYIKGREFACGVIDGEALPRSRSSRRPVSLITRTNIRRTRHWKYAPPISRKRQTGGCAT